MTSTSAATSTTDALTRTPRFDRIVAERWLDWEAAVLIWLQSQPLSTYRAASRIESAHREWLAILLARGFPLRVIRRLGLDDPRESRPVLEDRARVYSDHRLKRSITNVTNE